MNKKVVIIGAGPCGLLLAHYLLHRGQYQVEIYEGRSQQNLINTKENRTFPLSLQERGRKAIRGIAGLEEAVMSESIFCQGTIIHRQQGKKQKIKRKTPILTIDRNRLVTLFFEKLQENYPCEYLKIHFNCECIEINKITKTVTLQAKMGDHFRVNYDLLIGADGANSAIRKYLEQQANLYCEQHYVPDAYKSLFFNRINAELNIALEPNRIHASNTGKNIRILMVTQPEEKLHGVLLFPLDKNPFTSLSNQEDILGFFQENFPAFAPLITQSEAEALLNRPVSRVLTVRCDRFHEGDSILIMGDAAHAVSPSLGQGCNRRSEQGT